MCFPGWRWDFFCTRNDCAAQLQWWKPSQVGFMRGKLETDIVAQGTKWTVVAGRLDFSAQLWHMHWGRKQLDQFHRVSSNWGFSGWANDIHNFLYWKWFWHPLMQICGGRGWYSGRHCSKVPCIKIRWGASHVWLELKYLISASSRFNITIQDLKQANKLWTNEGLWPGKSLRIPHIEVNLILYSHTYSGKFQNSTYRGPCSLMFYGSGQRDFIRSEWF